MTMTVLQLLPDLNVGGVERGTVEISDALVKAGHRAIVVSAHGRLVDELTACGAQHIALPIGKKSLTTLKYVSRLREIILANNVDVVHARSRLPAWIGWFAIKGLKKADRPRWVTTVHGPYTVNRYSEIMLSGEKVIAISQFINSYITDNYPKVDSKKITIIHRGVDDSRYHPQYRPTDAWLSQFRDAKHLANNEKILLFPGRLNRWKGQHTFIEMIDKLRREYNGIVALIVGSQTDSKSSYESELRKQVVNLGLEAHVQFLGQRNDMLDLLSIADISFSLPEIPEAFGRTTLEALAVGTPVIGYQQGGTGEILAHLFPAGLVRQGSVDEVVAKAAEFLRNPPIVEKNKTMTLTNMQTATLAVYASLLDQ